MPDAIHRPRSHHPQEFFMRLPDVLAAFPVSRSSWYQGIKEGRFPAPGHLSKRTAAWRVSDIRALLASYGETANDAEA